MPIQGRAYLGFRVSLAGVSVVETGHDIGFDQLIEGPPALGNEAKEGGYMIYRVNILAIFRATRGVAQNHEDKV